MAVVADIVRAGPALPSRTLTLLFSDFEDAPRLWAAAPDAMEQATILHREIVSQAVAHHGGECADDEPAEDGVIAVFSRPSDALAAAIVAQREAAARRWPEQLGERMRIAIHTSTAPERLGVEVASFGALSRASRLCAIAQGGQIVLSRATRDLVADRLPRHVELVDKDVHRLPDLGAPERVYELVDAALGREARPLRSLDSVPNNLPHELTTFIGRRRELRDLRTLLDGTRLLTLVGPGGGGKTRLALQTAADAFARFQDGIWLVELGPVTDPGHVGQALAGTLGVKPLPGQSALEAAVARLARRTALVVLDNCEHLIDAAAEAAGALLRDCPEVTVLATSRSPLRLPAETTLRVPPMSLPEESAAGAAAGLAQSDASRLFLARAIKVRPDLALSDEAREALVRICSELDGIPLAIELAAARVGVLSLEQIEDGLSDRFRLLTGAAGGSLLRHGTLRASVAWSHDLLSDEERTLFRRLGIFTGGFTLDAVEHVAAPDPGGTPALDLLAALVDKSLVVTEERGGALRYRLLETMAEYAVERLAEAGELDAARDRHRDFFLSLAERAAPELVTTSCVEWLEVLDAEAANLASALDWAAASDGERALRMCSALIIWWKLRGMFAEGDAGCARSLEASGSQPSALRARVLWGRAYLLAFAARYVDAFGVNDAALRMAEEVADASTTARALFVHGTLHRAVDPAGSVASFERSRELARESGDDWCFAASTVGAGWCYVLTEEHDQADRLFEECLPIIERMGYHEFICWALVGVAYRYTVEGDFDRFIEIAERGVSAAREIGEPTSEGAAHATMARIEVTLGRFDQALARLEVSRERVIETGAGFALPPTDIALAATLGALGDLEQARATLEGVIASGADFGWILSWAMVELAGLHRVMGDLDAAEERAHQALEITERIGNRGYRAWATEILGRVAGDRGRWGEAESLLHEALAVRAGLDMRYWLTLSLDGLVELAAGMSRPEEAVRLLAANARARSESGFVRWPPEQPGFDALERALREGLGDEAFDTAWSEGSRLTLAEAVSWVRRGRGSRKRPPGGWESLTPTELEVSRHAAAGLTNTEIGEAMFISRGTVKSHLSHIYAKLGLRNRAELTARAAQHLELGRP